MKLQAKILIPILAVSLTQLARAIGFTSAVSGNWSDPVSWGGVALDPVPDTYLGDDATILGGFSIDYNDIGGGIGSMSTPAGLGAAGGFAIGDGHFVLLDNGTLTQSTLTQEMRIGEGTSGTGVGTLTIDNGGLLNTGASIGLGVGTKISGLQAGNGTLDIRSGSLIMGLGALAGGLGIGIQGSNGVMLVGDGAGGPALVDLATNDIQMGIGVQFGAGAAGTGAVTVNSDGTINFKTKNITVGSGGGTGTLTLLAGGTLAGTSGALLIGDGALSTGTLANAGTIGNALSTGEVRIGGNGGTGTFNMTTGTLTTTGEVNIGRSAGTGTLNMTAGSLTTTGEFNVGRDAGSVGTVTLSGGALSVGQVRVGRDNGTATLNISGGTLTSTNNFNVGTDGGVGTVNQTGGTVTYGQWSAIGVGAGPAGSQWNISGGNITSTAGFEVGSDRDGTFNVSGAAVVNVSGLQLGVRATGIGTMNFSSGTVTTNVLQVAGAQQGGAVGTLNMSGGTMTINPGGGQSAIGDRAGSFGTVNISGVGTLMNNVSGQDLQVGRGGGTGNLNITAGGQMNHNWWINVARDSGSTGNLTIDGAGSMISQSAGRINVGENGTGTMTVSNGGQYVYTSTGDDDSSVGRTAGSLGTLNISTGGIFNALSSAANADPGTRHGLRLYVGLESDTSNGTINMSGGTLSLLSFTPGNQGAGTINQSGGTINVGQWSEIGQDRNVDSATNLAVYNFGGTAVLNTQQLIVGSRRTGTMNVSGGTVNVGTDGTVSNNGWGDFSVGQFGTPDGGSHGNCFLNQTGGTINSIRGLNVGNQAGTNGVYVMDGAAAVLNINNGEAHIGENGTGTLTVKNGAQAHLNGGWSAKVGDQNGSVGALNVESGGQVTSNSWIVVGSEGGSNGTVNISGAASAINMGGDGRLIVGRSGTGTVNQAGGTVTMHGWGGIGMDNGTGTYNLGGGTLVGSTNDDFFVGRRADGGTGFLTVSGTGQFQGFLNPAEGNIGNRQGTFLRIGDENGSHGTLTVNDSALVVVRQLTVGNNGEGTVNQNGGTVTVGQWLKIGEGRAVASPTNVASYTLNNGTINSPEVMVGEGRKGKLTVNGGTVNILNGSFSVGRWAPDGSGVGGDGTLIQTGGVINNTAGDSNIADQGGTFGLWNMTGGTANLASLNLGNSGTGTMTVDGVGAVVNTAGESRIGNNNGSTGTLTVKNGGAVHFNGGWSAKIGNNGGSNGTVNLESGGQITGNSWIVIGSENGSTGTLNVSGTTSALTLGGDGRFMVARAGTGTLNQSAGTITIAGWSAIALDASGVGTYNLTGGSLVGTTGDDYIIGRQGNGTLNMSGGNISIPQRILIASDGGSTGTANLTGGVVTANFLEIGGGTANVNIGGGTLRANQNQGNFLRNFNPGNSELAAGGATFDSNGFSITAQNSFDGIGGITKIGNGKLSLTNVNTYSGGTVINKGTLNINADAALGAAAGGVAINNNAILQAAAPVTTTRTVTLGAGGGQIDTNGQTVLLDVGSTLTGTSLTVADTAGGGVLNIKGTQTYNALTTNGGVTNVYTALGTGTSSLTANATTKIYVSQTLSSLTIGAGATVTFGDGLAFAPAPSKFGGGSAGVVPEPGSIGLLLVGALGLMVRRRRSH